MAEKEVCLVLIFNHRYDKNFEILDRIYSKRFQNVRFIVPFYDGERDDIIPVYENSHQFEGYIAQAARELEDDRFSHYVFAADDLILNPRLNSSNLLSELKVGGEAGYIKGLSAISDESLQWNPLRHTAKLLDKVERQELQRENLEGCLSQLELPFGTEVTRALPDRGKAVALFAEKNLTMKEITAKNLRGSQGEYLYRGGLDALLLLVKKKLKGGFFLKYPLATSYSDFLIVPSNSFRKFCHYCGAFAAMGLFVEVAIPTALILSCEEIVSEKDTDWRGLELWDPKKVVEFSEKNNYSVKTLFDSFGEKQLYLHPVKLSKWSVDGI